jgi:hypothetical protein
MLKISGVLALFLIMTAMAAAEEPASLRATAMSAMRAQMEIERAKENELQLLQFEVERLKLEVEKKKAVVELGKMSGATGDGVSGVISNAQPSVTLRYVFMGSGRKEAVFDVDGVALHVHEGSEIGDRVVKSIVSDGVVLKDKDGQAMVFSPGED